MTGLGSADRQQTSVTVMFSLPHAVRMLPQRVRAWIAIAREHYRAAGCYEALSRLSDAELRRRGLSRDTLARDLMKAAAARARDH